MTAAMSGTPEKVTSARFVARLTDAETTPGVARIAFSTRSTQESEAMPSTRMLTAAGFFGLEKREDIDVSFTNDLVRCWPVGPQIIALRRDNKCNEVCIHRAAGEQWSG